MYTQEQMILFATWFAQLYGDNTNATEADLKLWEGASEDWSGR